jgi:phosphoglycolate phosphatase-like HAD superfamily hydrolase
VERDPLPSWNAGAAKEAILAFVESATDAGDPAHVPPAERVAVFDNDGTLWCEKPMPVELGFILERLAEMAERDGSLRDRQPWKAAHERDHRWLGEAVTKHYQGDESDVKTLIGGVIAAFANWSVEEYAEAAGAYLGEARHPTLGRLLRDCGYRPMVELLDHLEARGFATYIASGGDRDFMRPVTEAIYNIPPERVVGSSNALGFLPDEHGGSVVYQDAPDFFADGPVKPVRIWSRVGRRPLLAAGNANGDLEMLQFAGRPARPGLRLLLLHDDDEREFAYTAGAERGLEHAEARGWTVVSMKRDWATVFAPAPA